MAVTWRGTMSRASSGATSRFSFRATEEIVNVLVTVATDDLVTVLEKPDQHVVVGLVGLYVHCRCRWRHGVFEERRTVSSARSGREGAGNDSTETVVSITD